MYLQSTGDNLWRMKTQKTAECLGLNYRLVRLLVFKHDRFTEKSNFARKNKLLKTQYTHCVCTELIDL